MAWLTRAPRALLPLLLLAAACADAPMGSGAKASSAPSGSPWSVVIPWGSGPGEAGLRAKSPDRPADGVSALAALGGDGVLLLDRLNARVLWASPKGARVVAQVPGDAEDLAAGPGDAFVVHSLLRARAWLFDGATPAGELAIDRNLRELTGLSLHGSRRVFAHNAHQETLPLGSPNAPSTLAATLHGKRKGARLRDDGTGVSVRLTSEGQPELLILSNEGRAKVVARHVLHERVLSARIVGLAGDLACLRLERAAETKGFVVLRRAVCVDLRSGARVLERDLGAPGLYVPRRELAVAKDPAHLVFMRPEDKGLRLQSWPLPAGEVAR